MSQLGYESKGMYLEGRKEREREPGWVLSFKGFYLVVDLRGRSL